jgi:hypothetical protein
MEEVEITAPPANLRPALQLALSKPKVEYIALIQGRRLASDFRSYTLESASAALYVHK